MKAILGFIALSLTLSTTSFAQSELSLTQYQDMNCEKFISGETNDAFVKFAREEITTMVEGDYCELRRLGSEEKDFEGPEFARSGINDAAHSKLIEALYMDFLGQ